MLKLTFLEKVVASLCTYLCRKLTPFGFIVSGPDQLSRIRDGIIHM